MSEVTTSRKTVTVLFSDLVESTALAERLDPERLARLLDTYFREMRTIVEAHGGTVEKFIGDAIVGVFGIPFVHEDDAHRAVSAALSMQDAMARLNSGAGLDSDVELWARIGINTGEVMVTSSTDNLALGHAMNMAARLQQAAAAGQVLIGGQTHALVSDAFELQDAGRLEVKGSTEPIAAFVVTGAREVSPRGWFGQSAFVGRKRELAQILDAVDEASQAQMCVTVTVLAPPGMGKSRLAAETGRRLGDSVTFLVGHCLPYGEGITYAALVDLVRTLTDESGTNAVRDIMAGESDADLVASVIELTATAASQSSPDETAWAFRRLVETLALRKPVVVVLDDLHWADPLFLDLVEYLSTFSAGAAVTLIGLARPDLLDSRPSMLTPRVHSILVRLEPLADQEMAALLAASEVMDEQSRQRIARTAGGVPLFAEQMAASEIEGDHDIPPSVRALLAARVDRLESVDRRLLEVASVEGEVFSRATVTSLSTDDIGGQIGGRLIALVRRDFVRPERSEAGRDAFRFTHALVRDAVYDQMPRLARSQLHERYASLLSADPDGGAPLDVIGHHLATAYAEALVLGDVPRARDLAARAATALGEAGVRAVARKQWRRGAELLNRAADLLADEPATRTRLAPELLKAYDGLGQRDARDALRDSALVQARDIGDRTTELRIEMALAISSLTTTPPTPELQERLGHLSTAAIDYFESQADQWNLADAWILRAMTIGHGDPHGQAEAYLRAQSYADVSGNESAQIVIWDELGYVLLIGETPFSQVRDHMQREIDWAEERGIAFTAADGLLGAAYCLQAAGEVAQARSTLARLRDIFANLPGDVPQHGESYLLSGAVELDAGNATGAIPYFKKALELFEASNARSWWHGTAIDLAHAYLDAGQPDEAARVLTKLDPRAGTPKTQTYELSAHARLASARGDHDEALKLVGEALTRSMSDVNPRSQARMLEDVAEINEAAGNTADTRRLLERALELYMAKEYEIGRARVEARLRSLG